MTTRPIAEEEPEEIEEMICSGCDKEMEKISTEDKFACRKCGLEVGMMITSKGGLE